MGIVMLSAWFEWYARIARLRHAAELSELNFVILFSQSCGTATSGPALNRNRISSSSASSLHENSQSR